MASPAFLKYFHFDTELLPIGSKSVSAAGFAGNPPRRRH
jgi:hypothetical protein